MPLIKKVKAESEKLKGLIIDKKILDEVKDYCKHFGVSLEEFTSQAFSFVLRKDSDWKKLRPKPKKDSALKDD